MPRAYDRKQLEVDRDPLRTLTTDYGKLPKLQKIQPLALLSSYLQSTRNLIGIDLTSSGNFLQWLGNQIGVALDTFGEKWDELVAQSRDAKLAADNANMSAEKLGAALVGGGYDEFDYTSAPTLPTELYSVTYGGPGAGTYGPSGNGYLTWKPSGAAIREVLYRRIGTTLGSNNGKVTVVWSIKPKTVIANPTYGYILGRVSNITNNTHIRAKISHNKASIEAVVSGTATRIGNEVNVTVADGDVFEFWYGTATQSRRFWLRKNRVTILDVEDTAAISQNGPDYRSVGFGCYVDNYLIVGQNPAPTLAGWTWAVQTTGGS